MMKPERGTIPCYACTLNKNEEIVISNDSHFKFDRDSIMKINATENIEIPNDAVVLGRDIDDTYYMRNSMIDLVKNKLENNSLSINYCPMCGKYLKNDNLSSYTIDISITNDENSNDTTSFSYNDVGTSIFDIAKGIYNDLEIDE